MSPRPSAASTLAKPPTTVPALPRDGQRIECRALQQPFNLRRQIRRDADLVA